MGSPAVRAQGTCAGGRAEFIAIDGSVEIRRAGTAVWTAAGRGDALCDGDSVSTGPSAQATLQIPDGSLQRIGANSDGRWTAPAGAERSAWDIVRGIFYFIGHERHLLQVTTPFVNAGVEGTEFVLEVTDAGTRITVIEGLVSMQTASGAVPVAAREVGFAAANAPGDALATVSPADDYLEALDWARYEPAVVSLPAVDPDQEPPPERAGDAVAWTDLAEARLAADNVAGALAAANRAVELEPEYAHAHALLGFAHLANFDHALAAEVFERAVALDDLAPLPHLGLGLAWTRAGDRDAGRREFDLAVALSPSDAVLRSYGGKAYADERDPSVASTQMELAQALDASEPTPWLYATVLKLSANNPVDALRDLGRAQARNGDRPVYRSSLALDEDQAMRSAPIGRVYGALGFEWLALAAGAQSIQGASRDYSGYRLLADSYAALPRHQIARVNVLARSQMLQPLNATPIPPQLAEPNMFILDSVGPAPLAFNEFNPLLVSNHWTVQGAATYGGNDTRGEYLTVSGIRNRFSYSVGQNSFQTQGFRENNDLESDVSNAFVQFRPNAVMSLIGELRSSDVEKGDLRQLFHEDDYNPSLRQTFGVDSLRVGMHRLLGERGDFLATIQLQDGDLFNLVTPSASHGGNFENHALDLQHLYRRDRWQLTSGATFFSEDQFETFQQTIVLPDPPFVIEQVVQDAFRTELMSAYAYSDYRLSDAITLTFGASVDELDDRGAVKRELNPKLGLAWAPDARTTVRAAAFSVVQGPLVSKENIQPRLEPTSVAGFNQFFFGSIGDEVTRYGLGIDRELTADLSLGMELSHRDIATTIFVVDASLVPGALSVEAAEDSGRAYVYWTPASSLALSVELQGDIFDNNGIVLAEGYARLETLRVPMQVKYFRSNGLGVGIGVTYVDQSGVFGESTPVPGGLETTLFNDSDQFWVVDASLTYRLRGRRGMLNLNVHNLFDEDYHFQDLDPENPRIMPDRLVSIGFTLAL